MSAQLWVPSGRQRGDILMLGATSASTGAMGFVRKRRTVCIVGLGLLSGQPGSRYAEVLGNAVL
jgi:hypothetical protein